MDVASDDSDTVVRWTVYAPFGLATTPVLSLPVPNLYISSASSTIANFFTASGNADSVVLAESVDAAGAFTFAPTSAVLRLQNGQATNILALPAEEASVGSVFSFPLGGIGSGAVLYIAAIGPTAQVTMTVGSNRLPVFNINPFMVAKVPLTTANTRVVLTVPDPTQRLLVVLAVNVGSGAWEETLILPLGP
jgi:hypothetical protein